MEIATKLSPMLIEILHPLLAMLVTIIVAQLSAFISARTKNENVQRVLAQVNDTTTTFVKMLDQTMVPLLKEASEDGVLTEEEKANIKKRAKELILEHLGPLGKLAKDLGIAELKKLESMIEAKIEATVADLRAGREVLK